MARKIKIPKLLSINELRLKQRRGWEINPKTRVVASKKLYKRSRAKQRFHKELKENS